MKKRKYFIQVIGSKEHDEVTADYLETRNGVHVFCNATPNDQFSSEIIAIYPVDRTVIYKIEDSK